MDDTQDDSSGSAKAVATLGILGWGFLIVVSAIGMANAKVGPAGDPDATDGQWAWRIELILGVVNTAISIAALIVAIRWEGSRMGLRFTTVALTALPILLAVVWPR